MNKSADQGVVCSAAFPQTFFPAVQYHIMDVME